MMQELLSAQFAAILDDPTSTERDVHAFLKRYPLLMVHLFNVSWNWYGVIPEFSLGTKYRADFVVVSADSGSWHAVFIELEGPHDQIYLGDGAPAKKLRAAQKQVSDWKKYVEAHKGTVKQEIAKWLRPKNVVSQNKLMGKGGRAHDEILLPDVFLWDKYKIMLGRRTSFAAEREHHMPAPGAGYTPQVSTYDRVIDYLVQVEKNKYLSNIPDYLSHHDLYSLHSIEH